MTLNFSFYLTAAILISGILTAVNKYFVIKNPKHHWGRWHLLFDYARAFFPVLLVVWVLRSFIIQPYRVPTGSLEPTVKPGDFIVVSQFSYGLRFPVLHTKFLSLGEPKRGDIVLFRWPIDSKFVFVKRVIGLPGDHVVYRDKLLTVNGVPATQKFIHSTYDYGNGPGQKRKVYEYQENLNGVRHPIFIEPEGGETRRIDLIVPAHRYFVMGDNRDDSDDSRMWGYVPEKNLIGRAFGIWFSWDPVHYRIRWPRIGKGIC